MTAAIKMIGTATMNNNGFEPGALALLIKAEMPENVMKVVELLYSCSDELILTEGPDGQMYGYKNPSRELLWIISGDLTIRSLGTDQILNLKTAPVPQSWLMPLKGDFEPEEEDQHVLLSLQN